MNNVNTKERFISKGSTIFLLGFIGQIIVFVISNFVSASYPTTPSQAIIISLTSILIGFSSWLIVRSTMLWLKRSEYDGKKSGLSMAKEETGKLVLCSKDDSVLCFLSKCINEQGLVHKNDIISNEDRLYGNAYVYGVEKNTLWKDIWIFSENISSEMDPFTIKAEPILVRNIMVNRTKYTIFYSNIDSQESEIESRKKALKDSLSGSNKRLLSFVPIDVSRGYIGKNTLPLLCGSILFSQNKMKGQLPVFTEGYLLIRKKHNDIPIYYKMPRCMLREYSNFFKEIFLNKKQTNKKEGES